MWKYNLLTLNIIFYDLVIFLDEEMPALCYPCLMGILISYENILEKPKTLTEVN